MSDTVTITRAQLEALAAKLDGLDLDEDERAVLHRLFAVAGEGEVSGYGIVYQSPSPLGQRFMSSFQPGGKLEEVGIIVVQ